ncbi:MAG: GNAT family protein [Clostridia bacterium]|nr:GNAT family protein [Clostridia bacterium]MDD4387454.1 GNAT family protein [Clostridia bacterium]
MYYKKYEGDRIYLSPIDVEDYQIITKWMNDETLSSGLGTVSKLISDLNEKEWLENVCKNGKYHFAVIKKEDNTLLGIYGLEEKDSTSRRFHVGGFIGEKENRGKGYGTEALKLITKFAFEILNAQSLFSGIYSFNIASIKSAEKSGYTKVGTFRKSVYYNMEYHDAIYIDIIREDYILKK